MAERYNPRGERGKEILPSQTKGVKEGSGSEDVRIFESGEEGKREMEGLFEPWWG